MNIFDQIDYRTLLKEVLLAKKEQFGRLYTFDKLANACKVQKPYISKVLGGDGHLSEDQVYLAAHFLSLNKLEQDYLTVLFAHTRTTLTKRRAELQQALAELRAKNEETSAHIRSLAPAAVDLSDYYLDPNLQLVHMFMTIPYYNSHSDLIAKELGISSGEVTALLDRLTQLEILRYESGRFQVIRDEMHLPPQGRLYDANRTLLRLRALQQIPRLSTTQSYNFSVIFSANAATRDAIRAEFLHLLKEAQTKVAAAPQEEVYQMNFDLFSWCGAPG